LQKKTALSTCEAELEAMLQASKEALYLQKLLTSMNQEIPLPITIYCDNVSALSVAKEPRTGKNTKHIDTKYYFLKEVIDSEIIQFIHVQPKLNIADIFTKPLVGSSFKKLRDKLVSAE